MKIKFKKQDAWVGVYWDIRNIWICLIPFFPINIKRKTNTKYDCPECISLNGIACTRCSKCPDHCQCEEDDF